MNWVFLLKWVVANTSGLALSIILAGSVIQLEVLNNNELGQAILGSTLFGISMGASQWIVLQGQLPQAGLWFVASILGFSIGFPTALAVGNIFQIRESLPTALLVAVIVGLLVGAFQALVLRRYVKHAILWITVYIIAMSISLAIWAGLSTVATQTESLPVISLLPAALTFSLITGLTLERMLNRPVFPQTSNRTDV
jgi:hypothetical protein